MVLSATLAACGGEERSCTYEFGLVEGGAVCEWVATCGESTYSVSVMPYPTTNITRVWCGAKEPDADGYLQRTSAAWDISGLPTTACTLDVIRDAIAAAPADTKCDLSDAPVP